MKNNRIKVLIVSYFPLNTDLSTGNTLVNIFSGMNKTVEFANIYFRDGVPKNDLCNTYFQISEKKLMKEIISRKEVGERVFFDNSSIKITEGSSVYNKLDN